MTHSQPLHESEQTPPKPLGIAKPQPGKTVSTVDLFDGAKEICIDHHGERYRLRITRRNKLILQK